MAGLKATITDDRLEEFISGKWSNELTDVPKLGKKTAAHMAVHEIRSLNDLVAEFLYRNGDLKEYLDLMRDVCPDGTHYNIITLLVLVKLGRTFTIADPPVNWEELVYPNK